ncbi:phage Tail Collar domain protein [Burkholderia sp. MSHR3999]|uniref:tail fiber protein n=1 Tax=Burkholderia sp. MSHR3999 TaxID=1542965 RepID=UPI0005ABD25A|nr:tail fiber protein [Burkholderia sp. MSHR3999]KIP16018.1 phage Tail Collar domain protein [Burkholderia sp. MSHR3999]
MATQILITDAGRAALVAPGNGGTSAHQVVEIGLANAPFVADKGLTKLPNELKRITTFGGANIAPDTIHATLKDDTTDQYSLYGFGLYLENGVLLAAYGQATPIMEKSPAALLLLSTDMQFATIDATQLVFGDASFLNPPATTERQGVVELATQAEVDAGKDAARVITPATLKPRLDAKADLSGAEFTGWISAKDAFIVSNAPSAKPSGMMAGNGDGANSTTANLAFRSWFGIGFGPNNEGTSVPNNEYSHWFDTRTGNTGFRGSLVLSHTRQAVISANNNFDGLTIEASNLDNTVKKPVALAPWGGKVLVGMTNDDGVGLLQVAGPATVQTPPAGDVSKRVATTEWVMAALSTTAIGQIVFEPRTTVRAGFLKANGVLVKRADYPALWAYAQASGALVSDDEWQKGRWACFSSGDGTTTFRLPEMRGEFIRCWDDARNIDTNRMIGSWQDSANRWHSHGASASEVGDHVHSAWTDAQGWHVHGVSDPGHSHGVNDPGHAHGTDVPHGGGGGNLRAVVGPFGVDGYYNTYGSGTGIWLSGSGTGIGINGDGAHGHNVGIGAAGRHSHVITVNGDGANESRPRNIALLAMIRAY